MKNNLTDFTGMRLVIDREDKEYYLFSHSDSGPGIVHGEIVDEKYLFNIKRGSSDDGIFSGTLSVKNIPFEFTKYSDAKIKHLLEENTNDDSKSQLKKELPVKNEAFEFFDPEEFTSGKVVAPPKSLSRKNRKAWYKEMKEWKEANGKGNVRDSVGDNVDGDSPDTNNSSDTTDAIAAPIPAVQDGVETDEVKDEDKHISQRTKTPKEIPYCGDGNAQCLLADHPEGYVIANHNKVQNIIAVLGTPPIPNTGDGMHRRFFVCSKKSTAEQLLLKLKEEPYYAKFVNDGDKECIVMPVTNLPVARWSVPALNVVNVYTLMNSELMLSMSE